MNKARSTTLGSQKKKATFKSISGTMKNIIAWHVGDESRHLENHSPLAKASRGRISER